MRFKRRGSFGEASGGGAIRQRPIPGPDKSDAKGVRSSQTLVRAAIPCMLAAMFPLHAMAITILIALFLLWKLDFIATMLNLKALGRPLPEELRGMYDDERLQK